MRRLVLLLALLLACRGEREMAVRVEGPFDPALITFSPPGHVRALRSDDRGTLMIRTDGTVVTVHIAGYCPTQTVASPLFAMAHEVPQVGFDSDFLIEVHRSCAEASSAELGWKQVEGEPVSHTLLADGLSLRGHTRSNQLPQPLQRGVVAVSPRTQGRYVFEAVATVEGREVQRSRVVVYAISRSTGMSSLSVSQRVLLGGEDWHMLKAPAFAQPLLRPVAGGAEFQADVPGRYVMADRQERKLELQALTHDRTPMDCGRAECHDAISKAAVTTAMSRAMELPGWPDGSHERSCMLACHAAGEPGLDDGGFVAVARDMGERNIGRLPPSALPPALQRLAGVRCTSCHGPATIPTADERARILRADVCAFCHDAPPRYTHVAEWLSSSMARSDEDERTRAEPCARCHSTGAFLNAQGQRIRADSSRDPDAHTVGVSCAACHAVHGVHQGELLRELEHDPAYAAISPSSRLCAACHSNDLESAAPFAATAPLWAGAITLPRQLDSAILRGVAPHKDLDCVACHGMMPTGKLDHSFRVNRSRCSACHDVVPRDQSVELALRAKQVLRSLADLCGEAGSHEDPVAPSCVGGPAEARYLAEAILADSAASIHGGAFARALIERAEETLRIE